MQWGTDLLQMYREEGKSVYTLGWVAGILGLDSSSSTTNVGMNPGEKIAWRDGYNLGAKDSGHTKAKVTQAFKRVYMKRTLQPITIPAAP